jgi:hypothetical protein
MLDCLKNGGLTDPTQIETIDVALIPRASTAALRQDRT